MDTLRGFEDRIDGDDDDDMVLAPAPEIDIGGGERRMHVRAYTHWVSLLRGRAYPSIEDLDPSNIADFGPHSVLLDFSRGIDDPIIAFLGTALRAECDLGASVMLISHVPRRSLLSRLTDHYLQIIANRAPIGFEAEFVSQRGHNTMYRGILMPFSSGGDAIDFIYGIINWKELVDAEMQAMLDAEVAAAVRATPRDAVTAPVWADGPSAGRDAEPDTGEPLLPASLADHLMLAQQTAAAVRAADAHSRAALYRALGQAHDFAAAADQDPKAYEALLEQADIALHLRAPMTPIAKLVFGKACDKSRLTEYAAVLAHARRIGVQTGALGAFLDQFDGGIKGIVKAERALRQPAARRRSSRAAAVGNVQVMAAIKDGALIEKAIRAVN